MSEMRELPPEKRTLGSLRKIKGVYAYPTQTKRVYEVLLYDRDTQRECVIETAAVSERKAVSNGWFRLARMEGGLSGPLFRSKNKDRYVVEARLKA
jgi:hypothetical protein